jgi:hypothetical protein
MRARGSAARGARASFLVTLLVAVIACGGLQQSYGAPHRSQASGTSRLCAQGQDDGVRDEEDVVS